MIDMALVLDELNHRYQGRMSGPRDEEFMSAEIRAICERYGIRVAEIVWTDGEYGRVCDIRIAPEPGEITINVVRQ